MPNAAEQKRELFFYIKNADGKWVLSETIYPIQYGEFIAHNPRDDNKIFQFVKIAKELRIPPEAQSSTILKLFQYKDRTWQNISSSEERVRMFNSIITKKPGDESVLVDTLKKEFRFVPRRRIDIEGNGKKIGKVIIDGNSTSEDVFDEISPKEIEKNQYDTLKFQTSDGRSIDVTGSGNINIYSRLGEDIYSSGKFIVERKNEGDTFDINQLKTHRMGLDPHSDVGTAVNLQYKKKLELRAGEPLWKKWATLTRRLTRGDFIYFYRNVFPEWIKYIKPIQAETQPDDVEPKMWYEEEKDWTAYFDQFLNEHQQFEDAYAEKESIDFELLYIDTLSDKYFDDDTEAPKFGGIRKSRRVKRKTTRSRKSKNLSAQNDRVVNSSKIYVNNLSYIIYILCLLLCFLVQVI
jgi:hypothetical protein